MVLGASPAPPGVAVNYVDPQSIGYRIVVSSLVTGSFALLAVIARMVCKVFITKSVGWDDYFSVIAMVFAIGRIVGGCIMVYTYGTGRHAWDDPLNMAYKTTSVEVAIDAIYLWAIMFAKLSILALYIRIFGVNKTFRRICWIVGAIVVFYSVACTPMYILGCLPSGARTWAQTVERKCVRTLPLNIAVGALNIATDTFLLCIPIPMLLRLQISKGRRFALLVVFGTGLVAWAASVIREIVFVRDVHITDGTWTQVADVMWLTIEMNIGIIAGCLPVLFPLVQRAAHFEKLQSYLYSLSNGSYNIRKKFSKAKLGSKDGFGSGDSESSKDINTLPDLGRGHSGRSDGGLHDVEMGSTNSSEPWFVRQQETRDTERAVEEGY